MPDETTQRAVVPPSNVPVERRDAWRYVVDGSSLAPTMTDIEQQALQVYNEALKRMEAAGHPVNQQLAHNIAEHVVAHGKFEPWMAGEQENLWKELAQQEGRTLQVTERYYGKPVAYRGSPSTDPVHTSTDVTILPSASADQEESELERNMRILGLPSPKGTGYPPGWAEQHKPAIDQLVRDLARLDTFQKYVDAYNEPPPEGESREIPEWLTEVQWGALLEIYPDIRSEWDAAHLRLQGVFMNPGPSGTPYSRVSADDRLTQKLREITLTLKNPDSVSAVPPDQIISREYDKDGNLRIVTRDADGKFVVTTVPDAGEGQAEQTVVQVVKDGVFYEIVEHDGERELRQTTLFEPEKDKPSQPLFDHANQQWIQWVWDKDLETYHREVLSEVKKEYPVNIDPETGNAYQWIPTPDGPPVRQWVEAPSDERLLQNASTLFTESLQDITGNANQTQKYFEDRQVVVDDQGTKALNEEAKSWLYEQARRAVQNSYITAGFELSETALRDGMYELLQPHMDQGGYGWAGLSRDDKIADIGEFIGRLPSEKPPTPTTYPGLGSLAGELTKAIEDGLVTPEEAQQRWLGILEAAEKLGNLPEDYRLDKNAILESLAGLTYAEASTEIDRVVDWYTDLQSTDAYKRMGDATEVERQFGAALDTAWASMPGDIGVSRDGFAAGLVGKTPEEANSSLATINALGQQLLGWQDLANERQREVDVLTAQQAFTSGESTRRNEENLQIKTLDHGQANYRADITRKDAQALNAANYAQRERENVIGLAAGQQQLAADVQQQSITGIEAMSKAIADENMQLFTTLTGSPLPPSQPGARIGGANIMDFLVEGVGAPLPGYAEVGGPLQLPDISAGFAEALALRRQQAPPPLDIGRALGAVSKIAPEIQQIVARMLHPEAVTPVPVPPSAYTPIARQPNIPASGIAVKSVV